MYSENLFGDERFIPDAPKGAPVALDLFTHAAERAALASGRPLSQERSLITHPTETETDHA
jgi:hypothetical protein